MKTPKRRKLTPEKRAAIARRLLLHPPEPTRVGSGDLALVVRADGSRVAVFYEDGTAEGDESLIAWYDVGTTLGKGDVVEVDLDALLSLSLV